MEMGRGTATGMRIGMGIGMGMGGGDDDCGRSLLSAPLAELGGRGWRRLGEESGERLGGRAERKRSVGRAHGRHAWRGGTLVLAVDRTWAAALVAALCCSARALLLCKTPS